MKKIFSLIVFLGISTAFAQDGIVLDKISSVIVQSSGTNENIVMSQKAVTDAISVVVVPNPTNMVSNLNGTATNLSVVGLIQEGGQARSVGYWTNSVDGIGTNGVYVEHIVTPSGTTNIYYSKYN